MTSLLREYLKLRYMGDCKCGNCQLIPIQVLHDQISHEEALTRALEWMLENKGAHAENIAAVASDALRHAKSSEPMTQQKFDDLNKRST